MSLSFLWFCRHPQHQKSHKKHKNRCTKQIASPPCENNLRPRSFHTNMYRSIHTSLRRTIVPRLLQSQESLASRCPCRISYCSSRRSLYFSCFENRRYLSETSSSPSKSSSSPPTVHPDSSYILKHYKIRRRGQEGHGSREYLLLPPHVRSVEEVQFDPSLPVAALFAHRNILFGARCFLNGHNVEDVCGPLVKIAVEEAEEYGEQPQGIANLKGLCRWVVHSYQSLQENTTQDNVSTTTTNLPNSQILRQLHESDPTAWEAVQAIASGVPRPGHSVVGQGTYRDGQEAWKKLAKEYIELGLAEEANLYQNYSGRLVTIEHLADTSPTYLKTAGGAMARFFFL
jgi:hypothetical protein